jgi:Zn ribbon nucleic-acid-binding protein
MALIDCPKCSSEDITGIAQADSRLLIHCANCGHEWLRGEARRDPSRPAVQTIDSLHAAFPTAADVRPDVRERVELLKAEFQMNRPEPDPEVARFRERYQELFSRDGLSTAPPEELLHFATSDTLASAGNMSGLTRAWKTQGPDAAAEKIRESIEHLLYGPESLRLEDRLTQLLDGKKIGFPSFNKEPLLTKVLCVVEPDRFLPVLTYTAATDGKKEIAKLVFDLDLPPAEKVALTLGRLVVWSNDLLRSLVVDIPDLQHAAQFLRWAKTQPVLARS